MAEPKNSKSSKVSAQDAAVVIGLSATIVAVQGHEPKVFIVRGAEHTLSAGVNPTNEEGDALPFGPFDPGRHATLELGLRSWVKDQTPLNPGYVEQLYTFGNRGRYAGQAGEGSRVVSIGYLALTNQEQAKTTDKVFWGDWYSYFPWEDWRQGKPKIINETIELGLKRWVNAAETKEEKANRRLRADLCFGMDDIPWDEEKVLERYELLYEARLIYESIRDKGIKNIRIFQADARLLMARLPDKCLTRTFVLNSDPWPKKKHHKRRFIQTETLDTLHRLMVKGSELRLSSDDPSLAAWQIEKPYTHPGYEWLAKSPADWRNCPPDMIRTRYQGKGLVAGRPTIFANFKTV